MIVEEYLKIFNYQLSGVGTPLTFFQTQMIVMVLGLMLYNKRLRCFYYSVLSIPSSHCACLDFTKCFSIDFFSCHPVYYLSEIVLFLA